MHPEIKAALTIAAQHNTALNALTLQSAEKLLYYMEDINLQRTEKFTATPAQSLYIVWNVEDWEFEIECIKNGSIVYTFSKGGNKEASGHDTVDEFIPQLEKFLLIGVA